MTQVSSRTKCRSTLVLQSHKKPLPFSWIESCLDSVQSWVEMNGFAYRFLDDELFDFISPVLRQKTDQQKVIATDIARLYAIEYFLKSYERVVWLDADFLIFAPQDFHLADTPAGYMLGREVWIQALKERGALLEEIGVMEKPKKIKLKAYIKVHNAFLLFERGNSFLAFYKEHAERLLTQCEGGIPPQFIGPKLLTALHNVVQCPVHESAGMFSPLVTEDLISRFIPHKPIEGNINLNIKGLCALALFKKRSRQPVSSANLCSSLQVGNDERISDLVTQLRSYSLSI